MPRKRDKFFLDPAERREIVVCLSRGFRLMPTLQKFGIAKFEFDAYINDAANADFRKAIEEAIKVGLFLYEGGNINPFELFLELISEGYSKRVAHKITATTGDQWGLALREKPELAIRYRESEEESTNGLEQEAYRRAVDGSDLLMIFLLKARKPDMYREKWMPRGGDGDPTENIDRFELGRRLAFSLRSSAEASSGADAGNGEPHHRGPKVGPDGRPTN